MQRPGKEKWYIYFIWVMVCLSIFFFFFSFVWICQLSASKPWHCREPLGEQRSCHFVHSFLPSFLVCNNAVIFIWRLVLCIYYFSGWTLLFFGVIFSFLNLFAFPWPALAYRGQWTHWFTINVLGSFIIFFCPIHLLLTCDWNIQHKQIQQC